MTMKQCEEKLELYAEELPEEQDLSKSCFTPHGKRVTLAEWMQSASRDAGKAAQEREAASR